MIRAALLLALAIGFAGTAAAKQISEFRLGAWTGGAYTSDETGVFSSCIASTVYNSGITMLVRVDRDLRWEIGFSSSKWSLTPGEDIRVMFRIDRSDWERVTAKAYSDNGVMIPMDAREGLVKRFRGGRMLELRDSQESFYFDLAGTSRLMVKLVRCSEHQLALEPSGGDQTPSIADADDTAQPAPVAPSQSRTQARTESPPGSQSDSASKSAAKVRTQPDVTVPGGDVHLVAEGTRVLSNFLTNAGLNNSTILPPSDVPASLSFAHSVATTGGQVAFVFVAPAGANLSENDVTSGLSAKISGACDGNFLSGSSKGEVDGALVTNGFAACEHNEELTQVRFVVTPRGGDGIYLIGLVSGEGGDWSTSLQQTGQDEAMDDEVLRQAAYQASR